MKIIILTILFQICFFISPVKAQEGCWTYEDGHYKHHNQGDCYALLGEFGGDLETLKAERQYKSDQEYQEHIKEKVSNLPVNKAFSDRLGNIQWVVVGFIIVVIVVYLIIWRRYARF